MREIGSAIAMNATPLLEVGKNFITTGSNIFSSQSNFSGLNALSTGLSILSLQGLYEAYEKLQIHGASISDDNWRGEKGRELTFSDFITGAKSKPFHLMGMFACVGLVIGTIVSLVLGQPLVALGLSIAAVAIAKINSHYIDVPVHEYQQVKEKINSNIEKLTTVITEIHKYVDISDPKATNKLNFSEQRIDQLTAYSKTIEHLKLQKDEILANKTPNIRSEINDMNILNKMCKDIIKGVRNELLNGNKATIEGVDQLFIKEKTKQLANIKEDVELTIQQTKKLNGNSIGISV